MLAVFFEATNKNLLLGNLPESLGLLIFGVALIAFAIGLRWVFNRNEKQAEENFEQAAERTNQ